MSLFCNNKIYSGCVNILSLGEGWKDGRGEGWKDGRGEGWKDGRGEGWKREGWKRGRMEEGKDGRGEGWILVSSVKTVGRTSNKFNK